MYMHVCMYMECVLCVYVCVHVCMYKSECVLMYKSIYMCVCVREREIKRENACSYECAFMYVYIKDLLTESEL